MAVDMPNQGKPDYSHVIETTYRKYNFRSRLEAKWAVFFDRCNWPWSYEPIDLPGWIPDFAIGHAPTLVELKPFFKEEEWAETIQKIVKSGYRKSVVLLGADPVLLSQSSTWDGGPHIGLLLEFDFVGDEARPICWDLNFGFTEGNGHFGLCPMSGGWSNVIWKAPAGISHANKWSRVELRENEFRELSDRWADACNLSKWIPSNDSNKRTSNPGRAS